MKPQKYALGLVPLVCAIAANPAKAITPIFDGFIGGEIYATNSWTVGYEFVVSGVGITVDALGSYDARSNGLGGSYEVGLWDSVGNLLASATVNNSSTLVSGFRWTSISPLTLNAGNYVVGSAGDWFSNGDDYLQDPIVFATLPGIAWDKSRYNLGSALTFPTTTDGSLGFWGGNVSVGTGVGVDVDVPGPFPALGAGVAFGYSRKLRKRIARCNVLRRGRIIG